MTKNAGGFEIYLNCADPKICKRLLSIYPIDGVTSNPQMIASLKRPDFFKVVKELREACGEKTLFLQTPSNNYEGILRDAETLREAGGAHTIVKIPCNADGIRAIQALTDRGIPTLGTQIMSAMQGIMALKAGAKYVAPFFAPMEFSKINGAAVFKALVEYRKISGCEGQIMGCAPRNQEEVAWIFTTGVTAVTLDPCDFEDPVTFKAFADLNKDVRESWEAVYGVGTHIYDMKK